jgi:hypothetical protein
VVAVDVRDRLNAIPCGLEEVPKMIDQRTILVSCFHGGCRKGVGLQILNGFAADPSAVHEQTSFGPLEEDPIVSIMADFDFNALREFGSDEELGGCIVTGRIHRISILEVNRMLDRFRDHLRGTCFGEA